MSSLLSNGNSRKKELRPFCQVTGCFERADVYIVLKETEDYDCNSCDYDEDSSSDIKCKSELENELFDLNQFKLILYFCNRHNVDFKYLLTGSELQISKKCNLNIAPSIIRSR